MCLLKLLPYVDHESIAKSQFATVLPLNFLAKYPRVRLDRIHTHEVQNRGRMAEIVVSLQNGGRGKFLAADATDKQPFATCT